MMIARRDLIGGIALAAVSLQPGFVAAAGVNDASRNKVLSLLRPATGEAIRVTYWRGEWYNPQALRDLSTFLRDPQQESQGDIDPALLDFLHAIVSALDYRGRVVVFDAILSENTLARRGGGEEELDDEYHRYGRALDFTIPDQPMERVRDVAEKLGLGGVGFLPTQSILHIDTGEVRSWTT